MIDHILTGLYVPGDRPDRFEKAVDTGAQLIIIDLEDAVARSRKQVALDAAVAWLTGRPANDPLIQIRVNPGADHEVEALRATGFPIELRLPKVEDREQLDRFALIAQELPITAIVESARGVENATAIAEHPAVTRIALGEADLASDVGSRDAAVVDYARLRLVFAARAAGLPAPMLSVYPDIRDLDGLRRDTERGKRLGMVGRLAAHPSQLAAIAETFEPTGDEISWARAVLDAVAAGGVQTLPSGEMVDQAMVGRARRILGER